MKLRNIEIGKIYYALPRGFNGDVRCEVLKVLKHSAIVKIICCDDLDDYQKQIDLLDKVVIPLKNFKTAV